jgi:hypothetical protein
MRLLRSWVEVKEKWFPDLTTMTLSYQMALGYQDTTFVRKVSGARAPNRI